MLLFLYQGHVEHFLWALFNFASNYAVAREVHVGDIAALLQIKRASSAFYDTRRTYVGLASPQIMDLFEIVILSNR